LVFGLELLTPTNFGRAQAALSGRIVNLQARFSF